MTERYVDEAKQNMGAFERLLKGLPGIRSYVDKELRRDADKRLRDMIASQLEEQKKNLLNVQKKLLGGGGLAWLDDVDGAIQKLQLLIDRIKTASYGYAGLFDAVRIREEQLDALHRFDVALAGRVVEVENAIKALAAATATKENMPTLCEQLVNVLAELSNLFSKRQEAIIAPDLLTNAGYAPAVDLPPDSKG